VKQISRMTIGELAAHVSCHLASRGIKVVLSGGACVTIYAANLYRSDDLDFIESGPVPRRKLKQALEEIGFKENNRYFTSPDTRFFLEFPAGPLAVGREPVKGGAEAVFHRYPAPDIGHRLRQGPPGRLFPLARPAGIGPGRAGLRPESCQSQGDQAMGKE
jgi:hypothetical protein